MGLLNFLKFKLRKDTVKFDIRFFDKDSIPSNTGLKLSGNIVLKGFSKKRFCRSEKEDFYLKILKGIVAKEHQEWMFIEMDLLKKNFIVSSESDEVVIEEVIIDNLQYVDKKFYDPLTEKKGLAEVGRISAEVNRQIEELKRLETEEIAKSNREAEEEIARLKKEYEDDIAKIRKKYEDGMKADIENAYREDRTPEKLIKGLVEKQMEKLMKEYDDQIDCKL